MEEGQAVDDDVRVRAVAFTALQKVGHQVLEASSVAAAFDLARSHGRNVDLLLTDVVMEGGGGAEVIRRVRDAIPSIKILVMSGYADDETLRRGIAQGQFPFIAKPFTSDTLCAAVDRVLRQVTRKEWSTVDPDLRLGLSWREYEKVRGKYGVVLASPIIDDRVSPARVVGCVAVDAPSGSRTKLTQAPVRERVASAGIAILRLVL